MADDSRVMGIALVVIMLVFAFLAFLFGFGTLVNAPAVTQQIAGLLMFVISAVFLVGGLLTAMLVGVRHDLRAHVDRLPQKDVPAPAHQGAVARPSASSSEWINCPHCRRLIRHYP